MAWAITPSNSASEDPSTVVSAPIKFAKPDLQQPHAPSSVVPKQNPPHSQSSSTAVSSTPGDCPGMVNPVTITNICPPCKTALATQTLLQKVEINMNEDSEENSDRFEDEHKDPDKGFNNNLHYGSEVEVGSITFEPVSELTTTALPNKKSATTSTSHGLEKTLQAPPGPLTTDDDKDNDGEFSSVSLYIHVLTIVGRTISDENQGQS